MGDNATEGFGKDGNSCGEKVTHTKILPRKTNRSQLCQVQQICQT